MKFLMLVTNEYYVAFGGCWEALTVPSLTSGSMFLLWLTLPKWGQGT